MSTVYVIRVTCDDNLSDQCHGLYELRGRSPRDFDHAGTELFQQGWVRGFAPRPGVEPRTSDDYVAVDTCPSCAERVLRPVPHERQTG